MKRITFWPQLFLGIIFNWGVIICSVEFFGTITKEYLIYILQCVLWTIGYDTIYAYQDLKDDKKNNIKSTAVLFEDKGKYLVVTSYALMLTLIGYLSLNQTFEILKMLVYLSIFIYIIVNIIKWDHKSKQNSGKKFRQNNLFGAIIFLYLLSF
jgi:4-hydroxybenzoate polyprenyltransferase